MKRMIAIGLIAIGSALLVLFGLIAFGTRSAPTPMASIADPFDDVDFSGLPKRQTLEARDGTDLAYRLYSGNENRVMLALHGSSTQGRSLHPLAEALSRRGMTVIVPDIRGHGASDRRGDIDYIGQLENDLADFVAHIQERWPGAKLSLLGFSSGGGLALRYAGSREHVGPDRLVLISPMLGIDSPPFTDPNPNAHDESWSRAFVPRIIGLSILNGIGIHALDYLPVVAFAVDPQNDGATPRYSHRLLASMNPKDYRRLLEQTPCPIILLAGSRDEVFNAKSFGPAVHAVSPKANVHLVDDIGHVGMTLEPAALDAVADALLKDGGTVE